MGERRCDRLALVATTPDDSHAWNLVGVQMQLEERGFQVINLGPCTPAELLARSIRDLRPDLVAISTVNGHGVISLGTVLDALDLYQVRRSAPIVIGGLLATGGPDAAVAAALLGRGVSAVFTGEGAWPAFDRFLASEIRSVSGERRPPEA